MIDDFIKPANYSEGKDWGMLTIDASCIPAEITEPTDLNSRTRRELQSNELLTNSARLLA